MHRPRLAAHPRATAIALVVAFLAAAVALGLYWPVGIVLGLGVSLAAVGLMGRRMVAAADAVPLVGLGADPDDELRDEVDRLKTVLGDDFADFARAADLVVGTQRASAAGLQKGLTVPQARARHLLGLLERERFVGPHAGNRPRSVLVPAEHLGALRRAFEPTA